jgi:aspartyl-tRNA(Asn)/glutamyl-tRNA(Gln) amidotransferase subunit B
VALMEIVSRPDMRSPAEAGAYLHQAALDPALCRVVRRQHGSGLDARRRQRLGAQAGDELGTRTETKNVNSVRFVMQAIEHEALRQVEVIESGGTVVQETRLFDPDTGTTRSMRSKEDAHDYRYFPDPDLLPLELDEAFLADCRASLPELPDAKRRALRGAGARRLQRARADRRGRDLRAGSRRCSPRPRAAPANPKPRSPPRLRTGRCR